uniref:ATP receptor n=1 Tax=Macrostomum lignano TaxID=282301 RepID=A0A1I8ISC6_9PLAT
PQLGEANLIESVLVVESWHVAVVDTEPQAELAAVVLEAAPEVGVGQRAAAQDVAAVGLQGFQCDLHHLEGVQRILTGAPHVLGAELHHCAVNLHHGDHARLLFQQLTDDTAVAATENEDLLVGVAVPSGLASLQAQQNPGVGLLILLGQHYVVVQEHGMTVHLAPAAEVELYYPAVRHGKVAPQGLAAADRTKHAREAHHKINLDSAPHHQDVKYVQILALVAANIEHPGNEKITSHDPNCRSCMTPIDSSEVDQSPPTPPPSQPPPLAKRLLGGFFEYKLQKVVVVRSVRYGLFYRGVQLSVIVYFLFYIIWHKKGYQGQGAATRTPAYGARVWDAADVITPPVMNGAVFITTSAAVAGRQAMTVCPEGSGGGGRNCSRHSDCPAGSLGSRGRRTGECDPATGSCLSYGWCPSPDWTDGAVAAGAAGYTLTRVGQFTIQVKNSVDFRQLGRRRRNILEWMTADYLASCRYTPGHANLSYCPVFRLADILTLAGCDHDDVLRSGGAFAIDISWRCNFDLAEELCQPEYRFREVAEGDGYVVEYAHKYQVDGQPRRMLIRARGVKISVTVSGEGGQFSFYCLSMNLGSGLALFGLSSMLCDAVLLRLSAGSSLQSDLNAARVDFCEPERRVAWRRKLSRRLARAKRRRRIRRLLLRRFCCGRGGGRGDGANSDSDSGSGIAPTVPLGAERPVLLLIQQQQPTVADDSDPDEAAQLAPIAPAETPGL